MHGCLALAGIAQLVEHQPSKLRVAGSRPVSRSIIFRVRSKINLHFQVSRRPHGKDQGTVPSLIWLIAHVAQQVEHFLGKEEVTGSSPVVGSSGRVNKFFCSRGKLFVAALSVFIWCPSACGGIILA